MVPARAMVCLSQKPSTENGQFRVAVLMLAWFTLPDPQVGYRKDGNVTVRFPMGLKLFQHGDLRPHREPSCRPAE